MAHQDSSESTKSAFRKEGALLKGVLWEVKKPKDELV